MTASHQSGENPITLWCPRCEGLPELTVGLTSETATFVKSVPRSTNLGPHLSFAMCLQPWSVVGFEDGALSSSDRWDALFETCHVVLQERSDCASTTMSYVFAKPPHDHSRNKYHHYGCGDLSLGHKPRLHYGLTIQRRSGFQ